MKKVLFIICGLISLTASSCDKKEDTTDTTNNYNSDLYKNSPRSEVPSALAMATWTSGNISAIGYYNDNGDHIGNAYSAAREYKVTKDGYYEFAQLLVVEGSTSSCINEYFSHMKGTLKFEGTNKVTFYPVEGNFRTVKTSRLASNTSCPKSDTRRVATKEDEAMKATTYYWKTVTDNNKLYFQVFEENDPNMQNATFVYEVSK
jgi:hypothetical protein